MKFETEYNIGDKVEIDADRDGNKYLTIHCGSRNFGLKVATYYQKKAVKISKAMKVVVPNGLEYLPNGYGAEDYLSMIKVAHDYACANRRMIIERLLEYFDVSMVKERVIESVHNYISPRDNIVRKGAVSAKKGEDVIIPFNMADGIILGRGKSNKDYNFSAPHGAGRSFGRKDMKRQLAEGKITMCEFTDRMSGVYSTSVCKNTIDESPMAYKPVESVMKHIQETVDIQAWMKPVYNLKDDTK